MSSSLPEEQSLESEARAQAQAQPTRMQRTFSALRYRDFRLLWLGAFTSTTGTFMQTFAQAWLVYKLTGSAFLLGVDGFLATGPMLLFSLFGGVIADRMERRKVMLISQWMQMTFAVVLTVLVFTNAIKVWHLFLLSFLTGSAQSISGPAYITLLPMLVKREDVPNAVAMNSMQFNLARVIGPAIGGFAFAALGAAACFGLNALSFVAVIIAISIIRIPPVHESFDRSGGVLEEMREGFRFVLARPSLLLLTFLSFAGTFLGMPLFTLLPVVVNRIFGFGARGLSMMQADYGIGSVVGALFVASAAYSMRKGKLALLLQLTFAVMLIGFGLSRNLYLTLIIAFLAGACIVGVISMYSSLVQLTTDDAMRGRVMSIFMLAFRGGMPLGNLLAGFVAQRWSITVALVVNGSVLALIALIFIIRRTDLDHGLPPAVQPT
jgi:predicted MFS family arabinose efflux permease